jgi:hypothetical protein
MKIIPFTLLALAATACSEHDVDLGKAVLRLHVAGDGGTDLTVSGCQATDSFKLQRECVLNSEGPVPDSHGGELPVLSVSPPYGVYMKFVAGYDPAPSDVDTEGPDAAVKVYAAPYNVKGWPCCSEDEEANRLSARALFPDEGGVLIVTEAPVATGTQVSVIFDDAKLRRSHLKDGDPSNCSTPDECEFVRLGYAARFYVGSVPAVVGTPPKVTATSGGPMTQGAANPGP